MLWHTLRANGRLGAGYTLRTDISRDPTKRQSDVFRSLRPEQTHSMALFSRTEVNFPFSDPGSESYEVIWVAFKCDVNPCDIQLEPIAELFDRRDIGLARQILGNSDFDDFFRTRTTRTRSRIVYDVPLATHNTVFNSFRWRSSRRLSRDM